MKRKADYLPYVTIIAVVAVVAVVLLVLNGNKENIAGEALRLASISSTQVECASLTNPINDETRTIDLSVVCKNLGYSSCTGASFFGNPAVDATDLGFERFANAWAQPGLCQSSFDENVNRIASDLGVGSNLLGANLVLDCCKLK